MSFTLEPHDAATSATWIVCRTCGTQFPTSDRQVVTTCHICDDPRQFVPPSGQSFTTHKETEMVPGSGFKAVKLGGHFPGSLVALFDGRLLIADTIVTTPAGLGRWEVDGNGVARARPGGLNSFTFQWSIPNMIPLGPDELARMWGVLGGYEFRSTHGAFLGFDVEDEGVKGRVLESMQIQTRFMGWPDHPLMGMKV
uniref:Metallo-beta-lactamase domain-containing protein n=2 Tax=Bionectria ochroleuca TaxID=29856 RepID=A0A0B7JP30_BIOOC